MIELGVQDLCDYIGFSCDDACTQPSLPFLRKYSADMELEVDQCMLGAVPRHRGPPLRPSALGA
jgi:hypothetical protein